VKDKYGWENTRKVATAEPTVPAPSDSTIEHCAQCWRVRLMNISPVDCLNSYQTGHHVFFKFNPSNVNKSTSLYELHKSQLLHTT